MTGREDDVRWRGIIAGRLHRFVEEYVNGFDFRTDPRAAFRARPDWRGIVRQVAARQGFKIVGAVDIDPAKVGRDLGEVAGLGKPLARQGVGRRAGRRSRRRSRTSSSSARARR